MNNGGLEHWLKERNVAITDAVMDGGRGEMERQAKKYGISRQRIKEIVTLTTEYILDEYKAIDIGG